MRRHMTGADSAFGRVIEIREMVYPFTGRFASTGDTPAEFDTTRNASHA